MIGMPKIALGAYIGFSVIIVLLVVLVTPVLGQGRSDSEKLDDIGKDNIKMKEILDRLDKAVKTIEEYTNNNLDAFSTYYGGLNEVIFGVRTPRIDLLCSFLLGTTNSSIEDMVLLDSGNFIQFPWDNTVYGFVYPNWFDEFGLDEVGNHIWTATCVTPLFPRIDDVFFGNLGGDNILTNETFIGDGTTTVLTSVTTEQCVSDRFESDGTHGDTREVINSTQHHIGTSSNLNGSIVTVTIKHFINDTEINSTSATFNTTNTTAFNLTNFVDIFFDGATLGGNELHIVELCANATPAIVDGNGTIFGNIDRLTFDATLGVKPDIVTLFGELQVVSYTGTDNDGFLVTFDINSSGNYSAVLDTHEFNPSDTFHTSLVKVSDNITAVAFENTGLGLLVETTNISSDGTIFGELFILSINTTGVQPFIIKVNDTEDVYALFYRDSLSGVGVVTMLNISSIDGSINIIDSMEFETSSGTAEPIGSVVSNNILSVVYQDADSDGRLTTIERFANSTLNRTIKDSIEFETVLAGFPKIIPHSSSDSNISIIVFEDDTGDGQILTIDIADDGNIGGIIDTFEFDTLDGHVPEIVRVTDTIYGVAYTGPDVDGFAKTIGVLSDGTITGTIDTFEFNAQEAEEIEAIFLGGNIYASVFEDTSDIGVSGTVKVSSDELTFTDVTFFYNGSDDTQVNHSGFLAGTGFFSTAFNESVELTGGGEITIPNITFATPDNIVNITLMVDSDLIANQTVSLWNQSWENFWFRADSNQTSFNFDIVNRLTTITDRLADIIFNQTITHAFLNRWELNYSSIGTLYWNNLVTTMENNFGVGSYVGLQANLTNATVELTQVLNNQQTIINDINNTNSTNVGLHQFDAKNLLRERKVIQAFKETKLIPKNN